MRVGRVDVVVSSTDKNFMVFTCERARKRRERDAKTRHNIVDRNRTYAQVPVGGALIYGSDAEVVASISKSYGVVVIVVDGLSE